MKPALPQSTALSLGVAITQQFCRAKLRQTIQTIGMRNVFKT
jgi:hypothetical protein